MDSPSNPHASRAASGPAKSIPDGDPCTILFDACSPLFYGAASRCNTVIRWFATSRIVELGKRTKEESAKNVSRKGVHQGALAGLFSICRCIVTFLAVSLKIGEILSARRLYSRLCRMRRAKLCKSGPPFHSMVRSPSLTVSLGSICSHFDSTGGYELTKFLERIFNTATNDSGATVITVISNFILSDSQSISLTVARTVRICSPRLRLKLLVQCSKQCAAELTQ